MINQVIVICSLLICAALNLTMEGRKGVALCILIFILLSVAVKTTFGTFETTIIGIGGFLNLLLLIRDRVKARALKSDNKNNESK